MERPNYDVRALPTAPAPSGVSNGDSQRFRGKCPICMESWKIPTVLPVSGLISFLLRSYQIIRIFFVLCVFPNPPGTSSVSLASCATSEKKKNAQ